MTSYHLKAAELTVTERGSGEPFLVLHGGGGPATVNGFADQLAHAAGVRVITPVHPGFAGTVRPASLDSVKALAALYGELLDELELEGVTVVGNSVGGWVAAEIALLGPPRVTRVVLLDSAGLEMPGRQAPDVFSLTPAQIAELSFYAPEKFTIDPASLPPEAAAAMAGNMASLAAYSGPTMSDPSLAGRLGAIKVPALVLWGEADRMFDVDYGRAYAAAIPGSRFQVIAEAGHLPQLEAPQSVIAAILDRQR